MPSVAGECARGLAEAHRLTASGIFRTLALGVAANRTSSVAREAVAQTVTKLVGDYAAREGSVDLSRCAGEVDAKRRG